MSLTSLGETVLRYTQTKTWAGLADSKSEVELVSI